MTDLHARDVGDGVPAPRSEAPERDAQFARRARLGERIGHALLRRFGRVSLDLLDAAGRARAAPLGGLARSARARSSRSRLIANGQDLADQCAVIDPRRLRR